MDKKYLEQLRIFFKHFKVIKLSCDEELKMIKIYVNKCMKINVKLPEHIGPYKIYILSVGKIWNQS